MQRWWCMSTISGAQKMDYAIEKYWEALDVLVGTGPLQERLTFAAVYLMRLNEREFPGRPDLAQRHGEIMKKLTATPLSTENSYTPRPLNDEQAAELSREILSVFLELKGGL
jgi:hypothetical protein